MAQFKFLILFIVFMTGCQPIVNRGSNGTTVVCFGDSLTAGFGATAGHDYPSLLSKKISLPVINAGVTGNTTSDALQRLDNDVLAHDPKLVIITLGSNDYFRGVPKEKTLANMERIIDGIEEQGVMVAWAEVRTGVFADPYIDDFKALAYREHILFIPNILNGIINNPKYKYDQIHPNDEGYEIMAERIYEKIKGLI